LRIREVRSLRPIPMRAARASIWETFRMKWFVSSQSVAASPVSISVRRFCARRSRRRKRHRRWIWYAIWNICETLAVSISSALEPILTVSAVKRMCRTPRICSISQMWWATTVSPMKR
jgi:Membrane dipeptidase (Peptidase family M19)